MWNTATELDRKTAMLIAFISFLIALWSFLAFSGSLQHGFIFLDTEAYVVNNKYIRSFDWNNITWLFTNSYASNWHPLTWLSHALDYALYGLEPRGHHVTSIVIHSINAVGIFHLLLLLLRREVKSKTCLIIGAALAALLFGVHPQRIESVVWIAERKDVLCLFFSISTLISYTRFVQSTNRRTRWRWLGAAIVAFALALLSKPMAVTLPVILLILDVYPLRRISISPDFRVKSTLRSCAQIGLEKIPFVILSILLVVLTLWAQESGGAISSMNYFGMDLRLLNAAHAIVLYLYKFLIPVGLCINYPPFPIPALRGELGSLSAILLLVFITIAAIRRWKKGEEFWLISWVIFLITLVPVIGIVFVGHAGAADRYTYIPMIPFFAIIGFSIASGITSIYGHYTNWVRGGILIAALILAGSLTWLTLEQVKVWRSDVSLWEAAVDGYPTSPHSYRALGEAYERADDYYQAINSYLLGIELDTEERILQDAQMRVREGKISVYAIIYVHLASSYAKVGDHKNAVATYQYILDNGFTTAADEIKLRQLLRQSMAHGQPSNSQ